MSLNRILSDSSEYLNIGAFIIGLIRYNKLPKDLYYILFFVGLGSFTELVNDFYRIAHLGSNTMPLGHFYITCSILILSFFYYKILKGFLRKQLILALILPFILFAFINPAFVQSIWEFPNILGASGAILLVIFSLLFFSRILAEAKIQHLAKEPLVWINSAILFYYAGNFFYYILFNLSVQYSMHFAVTIGYFYKILNISFYALVSIVFLFANKKVNRL